MLFNNQNWLMKMKSKKEQRKPEKVKIVQTINEQPNSNWVNINLIFNLNAVKLILLVI